MLTSEAFKVRWRLMLCDQVREHLSAYLDRELTVDLSAAVRAHLDTCAECRALADDLRATVNLLGRLPERRAPGHLAGDVMREIERRGILPVGAPVEPQPEDRMLLMRRARAWPRALAMAATLVLALGIGIFAYLSDIGRQAAPAPESGVAKKAVDASKLSAGWSVEMGTQPAAPSDDLAAPEPAPFDKRAEHRDRGDGADLLALAPAKTAVAEKDKVRLLEEVRDGAVRSNLFNSLGQTVDSDRVAEQVVLDAGVVVRNGGITLFQVVNGPMTTLNDGVQIWTETASGRLPVALTLPSLNRHFVDTYGLYYDGQPTAWNFSGRGASQGGGTITLAGTSVPPDSMAKSMQTYSGGTFVAAAAKAPVLAPPAPAPELHAIELKVAVAAPAEMPAAAATARPAPAPEDPLKPTVIAGTILRPTDLPSPAGPPAAQTELAYGTSASVGGGEGGGKQTLGKPSAALGLGVLRRGEANLEKTMLAAVEGDAGVEQLSRAVTGDALRTADNQLVILAGSPDEADRNLIGLFKAAGWRPLAVDRESQALNEKVAWGSGAGGGGAAGRPSSARPDASSRRKLPPGGVYYRATRNGEDVWLVLADRDSLSRFGSRLAQAQGLTVGSESSADFRVIRGLQEQFREPRAAKANQLARRTAGGKDLAADEVPMTSQAPPSPTMKSAAGKTLTTGALEVEATGDLKQAKKSGAAGKEAEKPEAPRPSAAPGAVSREGLEQAATAAPSAAPGRSGFAIAKEKVEAKPAERSKEVLGEPPAGAEAAPPPADRILLVIRVQPMHAERTEADKAVPAATVPAAKTAP